MTKKFTGYETRGARHLHGCEVEWIKKSSVRSPRDNGWKIKEIPNTNFVIEADLVILALGFVPRSIGEGLIKSLGLKLNDQGNVEVNGYQTSQPWVFAAGDTISGASLVVHAINSGRQAAAAISKTLRENS
jgi:glutamate synthase (NADPH/NADH) small chain